MAFHIRKINILGQLQRVVAGAIDKNEMSKDQGQGNEKAEGAALQRCFHKEKAPIQSAVLMALVRHFFACIIKMHF